MAVRTVQISDIAERRFENLFEIYASSIPIREQRTRSAIEAIVSNPSNRVLVLEGDGEVVAFSIVLPAERLPIALLDYMAVRADCRGSGLGAEMFAQTLEAIRGHCLLIEVDSDREKDADSDIRLRRKEFYRRQGCLQIASLAYELPLPGEGPVPEMDLMVHFNSNRSEIGRDELRSWLGALFEEVYGRSASDPSIGAMLKNLADPVKLV